MSLNIKTNNFGNSRVIDLMALLNSVKQVMDKDMGSFISAINIIHDPAEYYPQVYYQKDVNGEFIVNLGSYDREWNRYAYQFAHEYCHIRTNYRPGGSRYSWFEESICEVASHYALKKMARSWKTEPPYKNWTDYAKELLLYSQSNIIKQKYGKSGQDSFSSWISDKRKLWDNNYYNVHTEHRDDYKRIAYKILPYFEQNPELWNAMTYWNLWDLNDNDTIDDAFEKWVSVLPQDKVIVSQKIIKAFMD